MNPDDLKLMDGKETFIPVDERMRKDGTLLLEKGVRHADAKSAARYFCLPDTHMEAIKRLGMCECMGLEFTLAMLPELPTELPAYHNWQILQKTTNRFGADGNIAKMLERLSAAMPDFRHRMTSECMMLLTLFVPHETESGLVGKCFEVIERTLLTAMAEHKGGNRPGYLTGIDLLQSLARPTKQAFEVAVANLTKQAQ